MKFTINGVETEGSLNSLNFGNDMMNGVLIDMPNNYVFLSDHVESHRDFMEAVIDAPTEHFNLEGYEIDWDHAPHSWVFQAIAKQIIDTAEQVCAEACE